MAIQRWDPLRDLLHLQERVNRLFEESLARSGALREDEAGSAASWTPPVDLLETEDRFLIRADVPGVESGSVDLQVEERDLVLRGERRADPAVPREGYLRRERPLGMFSLRLAIPDSVDRSGIQASQRDGVLEVSLPKRREGPKGRLRVPVK